jgi:kynurenine formamidase
VQVRRQANHAEHGVTSQRIRTVMHTGTHVNAPRHLIQGGDAVGDLPLETFFGPAVVIGAAKERWGLVGVDDLERAEIEPGDIVVIATGWHRFYADSQRYFAEAPGLAPAAAAWLVDRGVKLVAIDTPNVDHPLATSLGEHRGGPTARYLPARYQREVGRPPSVDFPDWNPAHRILLGAGVPTIENVGGAVNELLGRRVTIEAFPWRWPEGDACQVRMVALVDPSGSYRIEAGDR